MRIAVDAMGSDGAPDVEVEGAVLASRDGDKEVILVGDQAVLEEKLAAFPKHGNITIVHASEAIGMHEKPVLAVRKKKDASLLVALRLVKKGEADAAVSAGNTGAVMVASRTILGSIRGVSRSAISQALPTLTGRVVLLDLGANVDCTAKHLCHFAKMGAAYSKYALGVDNPRVGLLNIGEEMVKGGQVAREAYQMLSTSPNINFVGNIEPRALYQGAADVAVCDGFVGNVAVKTMEGMAQAFGPFLKTEIDKSLLAKAGVLLAMGAIRNLRKRLDYAEYGGAPLLGVRGGVMICHGSSDQRAIKNAIRAAGTMARFGLDEEIARSISVHAPAPA